MTIYYGSLATFDGTMPALTILADEEVSMDGEIFALSDGSANGTTPPGAKFWHCRFTSSAEYETATTKTPTLNGVDYPFTVTTMIDPMETAFANYTDQENYTETENYED
jgi:hypothetical protein